MRAVFETCTPRPGVLKGELKEDIFAAQLTDRDAEAVANPARFAGLGRSKCLWAERDYERKMAAAFREMHRALRDDGVLTVMFTHKRVEGIYQ